ncbi:hypothetical protein [Aquirufa sp. OSTEICH-129A]
MKTLFLSLSMFIAGSTLFAQNPTRISGYTNSYGTYVEPYYRTSPNSTINDNYSTRGNINPYTGSYGTKSPDLYSSPSISFPSSSSSYSNSPSTAPIFTGPRGGTYYYNSNGNKTYVK